MIRKELQSTVESRAVRGDANEISFTLPVQDERNSKIALLFGMGVLIRSGHVKTTLDAEQTFPKYSALMSYCVAHD
jgi:hypothetical protein